jgi:poly-gamma-glutamate capsule biosynthesis protein CapA/YwtB (metallophosphatase superfamily)
LSVSADAEVLMGFVGDVHVDRKRPDEVFDAVREVLAVPQVLFANLEGAYTDDRSACSPISVTGAVRNLDAYAEAGFNVMSLANNHVMDAGYDSMLATRSRLAALGVATCGAGAGLSEAYEPAVLDAGGIRIAFVALASVFAKGWEAEEGKPGLAPMRAYDRWREAWPALHAPGMRPLIDTVPDEKDLSRLLEAVHRARDQADLVIASFHWGDYTREFHLTDHEVRTARYCIDQGAHMVIGHHHHALRGMEWYRSRPIMYGLGHFVFDFPWPFQGDEAKSFAESDVGRYFRQVEYSGGPQPGWPFLPFPKETRMSALAWATASRDGIAEIGFLPCRLAPDGLVHPLRLDSPDRREVVAYVDRCNRSQGLNSRLDLTSGIEHAGYPSVKVAPD